MDEGVERSLTLATWLLPLFLALQFYALYANSAFDEEPVAKPLLRSLWTALGILIALIAYKELIALSDQLTCALMNHLGDRKGWSEYLQQAQQRLLQEDKYEPWLFRLFAAVVSLIRRMATQTSQFFLRWTLMQIRGYLLVFSTQVGPLAMAAQLLPGCGNRALATWLAMHLSFLGWGVTLVILDRMLAHVGLDALAVTDEARDSITTLVLLLMYLLVGPLTSLYLGHMLGNSFFAATTSAATRIATHPKAIRVLSTVYRKIASR